MTSLRAPAPSSPRLSKPRSPKSQAQFTALVDNAAKNAPAGSETAVAMMKSAVAAANNAFESVQKAVKQASDMAEVQLQRRGRQRHRGRQGRQEALIHRLRALNSHRGFALYGV
jgi:hypothetical protein